MEGTANAVIGRNLDGRIDEMRVWHEARAAARLGAAVQHSWGDRLLVGRWGQVTNLAMIQLPGWNMSVSSAG